MMNTLHMYPVPDSWDNPTVDDTNDDRPKKRSKYIAKAWSVFFFFLKKRRRKEERKNLLFEIEC